MNSFFQMAEVAVPKKLFKAILERIRRLGLPATVPAVIAAPSKQPEHAGVAEMVCPQARHKPG